VKALAIFPTAFNRLRNWVHTHVWLSLLVAVLFGTLLAALGFWLNRWYQEYRFFAEIEQAVEQARPKPATAADKQRVQFIADECGPVDASLRYKFVLNTFPFLETDYGNASVMEVEIERRHDGGIRTKTWNKFGTTKTLAIDWTDHSLKTEPKQGKVGLQPDESPPEEKYRGEFGASFGQSISIGNKEKWITVALPDKDVMRPTLHKIPYDWSGGYGMPDFSSRRYPIAIIPKMRGGEDAGFVSLVLVDVVDLKVIGEIKAPEGARKSHPFMCWDTKQDVLVALDYDMNWMMVLDMKPYVEPIRIQGRMPNYTYDLPDPKDRRPPAKEETRPAQK